MAYFEQDKTGNYHYVGNWQVFRGNADRETRIIMILISILAASILATGLLPGDSTHVWYVMGPYAFSFLTAGVTIYYDIRFMVSRWVLMEYEHKSGVGTASFCALLTAFLLAFSGVGQIVYITRCHPERIAADILIAFTALLGCFAAFFHRYRCRHKWHWELISERERQKYTEEYGG